jgi:GNAT superfamily N-acetyltransferase
MRVTISPVTLADDLAAICAQMQPANWAADNSMGSYQPETLKTFLEAAGVLLLAKVGVTIVGAALAYRLPHPEGGGSLYVHELDTHPGYRRRGIARALMGALMDLARTNRWWEVWVAAETRSAAANALYMTLHPTETEAAMIYIYEIEGDAEPTRHPV